MAVEHAPKGKRGFYGSWPQMGVPGRPARSRRSSSRSSQALPTEDAVPVVGLARPVPARRSCSSPSACSSACGSMESPAFQERQGEAHRGADSRSSTSCTTHPRKVLSAMGMRIAENGVFYIFTVFVLAYARGHAEARQVARCSTAWRSPPRSAWSPCRCAARCPTASAGKPALPDRRRVLDAVRVPVLRAGRHQGDRARLAGDRRSASTSATT